MHTVIYGVYIRFWPTLHMGNYSEIRACTVKNNHGVHYDKHYREHTYNTHHKHTRAHLKW